MSLLFCPLTWMSLLFVRFYGTNVDVPFILLFANVDVPFIFKWPTNVDVPFICKPTCRWGGRLIYTHKWQFYHDYCLRAASLLIAHFRGKMDCHASLAMTRRGGFLLRPLTWMSLLLLTWMSLLFHSLLSGPLTWISLLFAPFILAFC
jgi:hypothetical protein